MKTKLLIRQTLDKRTINELKRFTTANIAMKLLRIFEKHIGERNGVSRATLFREVFGRPEEASLSDDLRWDYTKKAMHLCRQRTKCFIGSMQKASGVWMFFVVESKSDAQHYINTLEKSIKAMRNMERKVIYAVDNKWSSLPSWIDSTKRLK